MENKIKSNIENIRKDIEKYSPYPEKVKLLVVTKTVGVEEIDLVINNSVKDFGENKAQDLVKKMDYFKMKEKELKWHFIGNLQKNKVKYIIEDIDLIHSINKLSIAKEVDKRAKAINRVVDILLEVNIAEEESKEGYLLAELENDIKELLELKNLNIIGLMTMAPFVENLEIQRYIFKKLRILKEDLNKKYFKENLVELSMGMSNDYISALKEGSTIIRIGTKIFI